MILGLLSATFLLIAGFKSSRNDPIFLTTFLPILTVLAIFVPFFFDLVKSFSKKQTVIVLGAFALMVLFVNIYFGILSYTIRSGLLAFWFSIFLLSSLLCLFRIEIFHSWLRFLSGLVPASFLLMWLKRNFIEMFTFNILLFWSFTLPFTTLFLVAIKTWELRRIKQGKLFAWWVKWPLLVCLFVFSIALAELLWDIFRPTLIVG